MKDINGEEFQVGDTLKVIKSGGVLFEVGTVLVCVYNDGSDCCGFSELGGDPEKGVRWIMNKRLQKL